MTDLITGVVGTSKKENEHRLPIHPRHLGRIPEPLRGSLRFERGYGSRFGLRDADLEPFCGGLLSREENLATCDVVVLAKPTPDDLRSLGEGATLWGWPHCVQQREITQVAIDRRLTLIAFEGMFHWLKSGKQGVHTFYKNNELAGYCSVLHAFELLGIDGHYGPRRAAAILGFGSVSRGAIYALQGRGMTDVTVYTQRPPHLVRHQSFGCRFRQMRPTRGGMEAVRTDGTATPLVDELAGAEVIVNGTFQNPVRPLMFLAEGEAGRLAPGTLIVDVSSDLGMGFPFARPTGFDAPTFTVGDAVYYGVDHSPSYLWNAATWEISEGVLPYLEAVMSGPEGWERTPTLARAIEIRDGVVQNPQILTFQDREDAYPHLVKSPQPPFLKGGQRVDDSGSPL